MIAPLRGDLSAGFGPHRLTALLERLGGFADCWIAYSGGLDSTALLHAAAACRGRLPGLLRAVHVDHGLQDEAPSWALHCSQVCSSLAIPLTLHRLALRPAGGESLEALAREARYRAFAEMLGAKDLLLTAHTQDDQAETLLLALLRGSGVQGLAAMPEQAPLGLGRLVRPLLGETRERLRRYLSDLGVGWVEDPSNRWLRMDRNYLRQCSLPSLRARWPGMSATIARSAAHCAEAAQLLEEIAEDLLDGCAGSRPGTLSIDALERLAYAKRKLTLRAWVRRHGFDPPDTRRLTRILDEVLPAGVNADPLVAWEGCEVRRYRDDLFAISPLPPLPAHWSGTWLVASDEPRGAGAGMDAIRHPAGAVGDASWSERMKPAGDLSLPAGLGRLIWPLARDQGGGDAWAPMEPGAPQVPAPHSHAREGALSVRFAVPGQSCRGAPQGPRRSLKKLFQEAGIPRWLRPYTPMLFVDDRLVAVVGVGRCLSEDRSTDLASLPSWVDHPWTDFGFFKP